MYDSEKLGEIVDTIILAETPEFKDTLEDMKENMSPEDLKKFGEFLKNTDKELYNLLKLFREIYNF